MEKTELAEKQSDNVKLQRSLTLTNNVQDVPRLTEFVDGVCEAVAFDSILNMQLNLAIEEAVVNVMNYAYPQGTKGEVCIQAKAGTGVLDFVIIDSGTPFDPTASGDVDTTLSAEERQIGGLGIFLVRQIMDTVSYEYKDGKNILTLSKILKA